MFTAGGWLVDRWLGLFPVGTVLGALLGTGLSSLSVSRSLQEGLNDVGDDAETEGS